MVILIIPSHVLRAVVDIKSPGNPIYTQKRVGRIGRDGKVETFNMYEFRSLHAGANLRLTELKEMNEADRSLFKTKDDPRVTRAGRFVRKRSIDEVPQFVNCFLGQISLRIIKTVPRKSCEASGLLTLLAKEIRTQKALLLQVESAYSIRRQVAQDFLENLIAQSAITQLIFTKRKFTSASRDEMPFTLLSPIPRQPSSGILSAMVN